MVERLKIGILGRRLNAFLHVYGFNHEVLASAVLDAQCLFHRRHKNVNVDSKLLKSAGNRILPALLEQLQPEHPAVREHGCQRRSHHPHNTQLQMSMVLSQEHPTSPAGSRYS